MKKNPTFFLNFFAENNVWEETNKNKKEKECAAHSALFLFSFVPHIGMFSNQYRQDLQALYRLRSIILTKK
jgi:hypothetical protein